jgi:hypothetical protein
MNIQWQVSAAPLPQGAEKFANPNEAQVFVLQMKEMRGWRGRQTKQS